MKYFKLISVLLLLVNFASVEATFTNYNEVTGKITRFGTYEYSGEVSKYAAPETATGYTSETDIKYLKETVHIELKKDIGFGFEYKIYNLPNDRFAKIEVIAEHPPIINSSGVTYNISRDFWPTAPVNGVHEDSLVYFFSNDYEMVPGEWTLTIKFKNKTLVKKVFHIEK